MSKVYRHGKRTVRRRHVFGFVLLGCLLVFGGIGYAIFQDVNQSSSSSVEGTARVVGQVVGESEQKFTVQEPLFSFELPADWKEQSRQNTPNEHSITWRATKKGQDNRTLTVYIDTIPLTKSINRLLPVTIQGTRLVAGDISDNCATFTGGGSLEVAKASQMKDSPAKWSGVDFICNMANVVDNQVGTGSADGVNQIVLTGSQGKHKYFFLFIDHNIQPNYAILADAVESFTVK